MGWVSHMEDDLERSDQDGLHAVGSSSGSRRGRRPESTSGLVSVERHVLEVERDKLTQQIDILTGRRQRIEVELERRRVDRQRVQRDGTRATIGPTPRTSEVITKSRKWWWPF